MIAQRLKYYYHYNDSMNISMLNPYVIKILISARKNDSIRSISKRINLSYGWTHKWVSELIKEGIFKEKWKGVVLQENNRLYKKILSFIKNSVSSSTLYYSVLPLFGIKYSFTKTDAVYLWTEGRYNIARYREFYPIFIKIQKPDYNTFLGYCEKLRLKVNSDKGIFYVPEIVESLKPVKKGEFLVDSLNEAISFMKSNIYNFEPALEMINEMYPEGKGLRIKYREANAYG